MTPDESLQKEIQDALDKGYSKEDLAVILHEAVKHGAYDELLSD